MSVVYLSEWLKKQEIISKCRSPLPPSSTLEELGLKPTDFDGQLGEILAMFITLDRAWRKPFKIKSTFARDGAMYVAICASEGFITTCIGEDKWGERWLITNGGMQVKDELHEILQPYFNPKPDPSN